MDEYEKSVNLTVRVIEGNLTTDIVVDFFTLDDTAVGMLQSPQPQLVAVLYFVHCILFFFFSQ